MQKILSPREARAKLTEYFDAARIGDYAESRVIAEELERFIDWVEQCCTDAQKDEESPDDSPSTKT